MADVINKLQEGPATSSSSTLQSPSSTPGAKSCPKHCGPNGIPATNSHKLTNTTLASKGPTAQPSPNADTNLPGSSSGTKPSGPNGIAPATGHKLTNKTLARPTAQPSAKADTNLLGMGTNLSSPKLDDKELDPKEGAPKSNRKGVGATSTLTKPSKLVLSLRKPTMTSAKTDTVTLLSPTVGAMSQGAKSQTAKGPDVSPVPTLDPKGPTTAPSPKSPSTMPGLKVPNEKLSPKIPAKPPGPKRLIILRPPSIAKEDKKCHEDVNDIALTQSAPPLHASSSTETAEKEHATNKEKSKEENVPLLEISTPCGTEKPADDDPNDKPPKARTGHTVAFLVDDEAESSDGSGSMSIPPPPPGCCAWKGFDIAAIVAIVVVLSIGAAALVLHLNGELKSFLGMEPQRTDLQSNLCQSSLCSLNAICVASGANYVGSNCKCLSGYTGDGFNCDDVDECLLSAPNCTSNSRCHNTVGSYTCRCDAGFTKSEYACVDINECEGRFYCPGPSQCINTPGSYRCQCLDGYHGDGSYCNDVDECKTSQHRCHGNATCINKMGSYACACNVGFFGNGTHCEADECYIKNPQHCDKNAVCRIENGAIKCICKTGFTGNGETCADLNECSLHGSCNVNAECSNTNGSYVCTCYKGFHGDGKTCVDIDECLQQSTTCPANALCKNTPGSYTCSCLRGYHGDECKDVDECEEGVHRCSADAMCINTSGSHECVCNEGFHGNGTWCECSGDGCGAQARCKGAACSGSPALLAELSGLSLATCCLFLLMARQQAI